jgi:hypothetical protein
MYALYNDDMQVLTFLYSYALWHYTHAFADYARVWRNALWFVAHLFSVRLMVTHFASPLFQLTDEYESLAHLTHNLQVLVMNTVVRMVSMVLRSGVLVLAFGLFVLVFLAGLIGLLIWTFAPIIVGAALSVGTSLTLSVW